MSPIPYPTELTTRTGSLESRDTVRQVEGKTSTFEAAMSLEDYLGGLRRILDRAEVSSEKRHPRDIPKERVCQLHPEEVQKAKDFLDGVERMLDAEHAEGMKGRFHD